MQLQENLFQSRKDGIHQNVATVVTQAEVWGTASERELSQALHYKYDALKDKLLRDALVQQVGVTEWAALSENDRLTRLAQMKLKVQALQKEGSAHVIGITLFFDVIYQYHSVRFCFSGFFFSSCKLCNFCLRSLPTL